jgi:hypothetical protein
MGRGSLLPITPPFFPGAEQHPRLEEPMIKAVHQRLVACQQIVKKPAFGVIRVCHSGKSFEESSGPMNVLYEQVTLGPQAISHGGDDFKTVIYPSHQEKTNV